MNTKEAKDFLVEQAVEQAALDNLSLSDLEKRMMYFTESDPVSCQNPVELNDEFEAQYDTQEYEAKMAQLLTHAYQRVKEDRKGDHYGLFFGTSDTATTGLGISSF
jgi:hypothetical protein